MKTLEQSMKTSENWTKTIHKLKKNIDKLKKTIEKWKKTMETSMKIMDKAMKTMENSIKTMEQNPETSGKIDEHCKWEILATKAAKTKEGNLDEKKTLKTIKTLPTEFRTLKIFNPLNPFRTGSQVARSSRGSDIGLAEATSRPLCISRDFSDGLKVHHKLHYNGSILGLQCD